MFCEYLCVVLLVLFIKTIENDLTKYELHLVVAYLVLLQFMHFLCKILHDEVLGMKFFILHILHV